MMLPKECDDRFKAMAETKRAAEETPLHMLSPELRDRVRFLVWAAWGIVAAIVVGALWINNTTRDVRDLTKSVATNTGKIDGFESRTKAEDIAFEQTAARLKALEEAHKIEGPQISKMWNMKEFGVSNKDAFFIEHGYPPPTLETHETQARPK